MIAVKVAPDSVQDKNHCTFEVVVEGRTFELLAMNEDEMAMYVHLLSVPTGNFVPHTSIAAACTLDCEIFVVKIFQRRPLYQ